ncbi:hypothetical protein BX286_0111 [Streptomyces sp. 3211.6]|nr:hypothetical protein BX286_0111 [Streptomyces sp. 3211.6]
MRYFHAMASGLSRLWAAARPRQCRAGRRPRRRARLRPVPPGRRTTAWWKGSTSTPSCRSGNGSSAHRPIGPSAHRPIGPAARRPAGPPRRRGEEAVGPQLPQLGHGRRRRHRRLPGGIHAVRAEAAGRLRPEVPRRADRPGHRYTAGAELLLRARGPAPRTDRGRAALLLLRVPGAARPQAWYAHDHGVLPDELRALRRAGNRPGGQLPPRGRQPVHGQHPPSRPSGSGTPPVDPVAWHPSGSSSTCPRPVVPPLSRSRHRVRAWMPL